MRRFDAAGWSLDQVSPVPRAEAYTLFSKQPNARLELPALAASAANLLHLALSMRPEKAYPAGAGPNADVAEVTLEPLPPSQAQARSTAIDLAPSQLVVAMFPVERGWPLRAQAIACGHSGMEVLASSARKIFQIPLALATGDPRAPLALCVVLAATALAAVLPPDEDALFGVKGARERLAR